MYCNSHRKCSAKAAKEEKMTISDEEKGVEPKYVMTITYGFNRAAVMDFRGDNDGAGSHNTEKFVVEKVSGIVEAVIFRRRGGRVDRALNIYA
jgi:hypothetical protein